MAPTKKNVTVNKEESQQAAKATVKKMPVKAEEVKAEAPKVEEVKTEDSKAEKPAVEKKTAKATEKKSAGRKAAAKTAAKSTAKKELKAEISVQFDGKSYSQEDLIKIAKDVWKYDLNQKVSDLTSIELYVKPEEHCAYYVMNKDFAGSFNL
ncbi:MAG: DUF6465 family protein [bacterium]|nr:DUF6465 family protein [bacterium]MCM1375471.1 DUF6465 family protein [Muribaculum sp.]